jgi:glycosyltransferase 2 family protein
MRVFYLGQLGKYLPGTIWPAVTQMRLGRDHRVPPRASGAAVVVLMLVGTGLAVGGPGDPPAGPGRGPGVPLAGPGPAPAGPGRHPAGAEPGPRPGLRLARQPPLPAPLSAGGTLRVAGWALGSWLCYGVQAYLLARGLGAEGGALLWLQCTGAFAAAFASGPLLLVVPAGAGVREAACCCCCSARPSPPRGRR